MKSTEFCYSESIQKHFEKAWRVEEVVNYGRAIDRGFYPAAKRGSSEHVNVFHAANLLYALAKKATKASIKRVLDDRLVLRGKDYSYFIIELAKLFVFQKEKDPALFFHQNPNGVKCIKISLDRAFALIKYHDRDVPFSGSIIFQAEPFENFAEMDGRFLKAYADDIFRWASDEDLKQIEHIPNFPDN
ncbi:MAG: hypothetical protein JST46_13195 [Bacteroidetes bacterium]|nr:hypothetical protein [Bacteroidota bacterium]